MKKLAIFFPGIGYHCDKPLLYYARKLTQECGYEESILLSYSYDGRNIRGDEQKMQQAFEALYAQAEQQLWILENTVRFCLYQRAWERLSRPIMHGNTKFRASRFCTLR